MNINFMLRDTHGTFLYIYVIKFYNQFDRQSHQCDLMKECKTNITWKL